MWKKMPFPVGTGTEGRCQLWLTPKSTSTISFHFTTSRTWRIAFLLFVRHLVYVWYVVIAAQCFYMTLLSHSASLDGRIGVSFVPHCSFQTIIPLKANGNHTT